LFGDKVAALGSPAPPFSLHSLSSSDDMADKRSPAYNILFSICLCHLINDMLQSVVTAVYPTLKQSFGLTFTQIGLITLTYQLTASFLQPLVGLYADRRPTPF
jgi:FSR family fosmidomycin resistance protein-like MFS transporter